MSRSVQLVVTGVGARTPVGLNVEQTCASIRAGVSRFTEHAYYDAIAPDREWDEPEPLQCATVPDVDPFLDYQERLEALVRPLLGRMLGAMKLRRADLPRLGVLLALPEDDEPLAGWNLREEFLPRLLRDAGLGSVGVLAANQEGHTGVFSLLRTAAKLLESGRIDHCLVGGLDSYLLEDRLEWRDEAWRLHSKRAGDGFIPGEACALLRIETRAGAEKRGAPILAALGPLGEGREEDAYHGERSSSGRGLIAAIEGALGGRPETMPPWVICDLNGESYRLAEWGMLHTRMPAALSRVTRILRPAESTGDIGAASGALAVACACQAFARGWAPAPEALLFAAADDGRRAALRIEPAAAAASR